jgi:hypothetical protein
MNNLGKKHANPIMTKPGSATKTHLSFKKNLPTVQGVIRTPHVPPTTMSPPPQAMPPQSVPPLATTPLAPPQAEQNFSQSAQPAFPQVSPQVKRLVGIPINIENVSAQKTAFKDRTIVQEVPSLDKVLEDALDEIKEQIQNYLEVCDTLSHRPINMDYLIEMLFVLARSLNFDFLMLMRISSSENSFAPSLVRGLKTNPPPMTSIFAPAISDGKIAWNELMQITSSADGEFLKWISKEKISSLGYVPFQDGKNISGFMILGSYRQKAKSQIASQLLELCGGRIGLAIAYEKRENLNDPELMNLVSGINEKQRQTSEYFELLSSSLGEKDGLAGKILIKTKDSLVTTSAKVEALKSLIQKKYQS